MSSHIAPPKARENIEYVCVNQLRAGDEVLVGTLSNTWWRITRTHYDTVSQRYTIVWETAAEPVFDRLSGAQMFWRLKR